MFTTTAQRIDQFIARNKSPEELAEKYEADKKTFVKDLMSDADALAIELDDMVFDKCTARLQTNALAFALVYGRNDDRTIDAFNRLETAIKKRLGEA